MKSRRASSRSCIDLDFMSQQAPQLLVNTRDIDSAKVDEKGGICLGETHTNHACNNINRSELLLNGHMQRCARERQPVSDAAKKMLEFCKKFQTIGDHENGMKVQVALLKKVEYRDARDPDGPVRKMPRCRDFEAAQLINLMPQTSDEAAALIPTLKGNPFLPSLIDDVQTMRPIDRSVEQVAGE
mmetsp:Transcript_90573/g.142045  ORF Transcript_90573/g.142045 Transcript_90573/m.142045 type:complete len:185 (+) Transcript_90573:9-563(+)